MQHGLEGGFPHWKKAIVQKSQEKRGRMQGQIASSLKRNTLHTIRLLRFGEQQSGKLEKGTKRKIGPPLAQRKIARNV